MSTVAARAARIRLLGLDVDGVLSDGRLTFGDDGHEYKSFHVRDGLGLRWLLDAGVVVAVISGRRSELVARRMESLGVTRVYQGCEDKLPVFDSLLESLALPAQAAAFIGDDLQDLPVMTRAGLAVAPADAHPLVRGHAHWCTPSAGGRGAVRELCELLLEAQGRLAAVHARYLPGAPAGGAGG